MQALIFGETNLLILCANYLLEKNVKILAVISHDIQVISWCNEKKILVKSIKEIDNCNFQNYYLFSIINPQIITKNFLENNPPILALNYHDSLLPKYAGINSTSWAILNGESEHGISWHKITENIDDGDIIYQKKIIIEAYDTAFSLNIKCTEEAYKGFSKIINKLSKKQLLKEIKQNLSKRTYYSRNFIPINYAIINDKNNKDNNKIFNALYLGENYNNPIATVKVFYKDRFYIIEKENYNEKYYQKNIVIRNIYGFKDTSISLFDDDIQTCILSSYELDTLKHIKKNEFKNYSILQSRHLSQNKQKLLNDFKTKDINLSNDFSFSELCAIFLLLLSKLKIIKSYIKIYNKNIFNSNYLSLLTDEISFIEPNLLSSNMKIHDLAKTIQKLLNDKITIIKDFEYRYKLDFNSDIAIIEDEFNYSNILVHKIQIYYLSSRRIKIRYLNEYHELIELLSEKLPKQVTDILGHFSSYLNDFSLVTPFNYNLEVSGWVNSQNIPHKEKTINSYISQNSTHQALIHQNTIIDYATLQERSNKLSRYLVDLYDLKKSDCIIIDLECSINFIIAIFASIKAGITFIPVNKSLKFDKIQYIINDSQAKLIISDDNSIEQLNSIIETSYNRDIFVCNIELEADKIKNFPGSHIERVLDNNVEVCRIYSHLNYGKAKAISIPHNVIINKIELMNLEMQLYNSDRLWMRNYDYYESTIWFMFWGISNGATLVLNLSNDINSHFLGADRISILYLNSNDLNILGNIIKKDNEHNINRIRCIYYNQESLNASEHLELSQCFGEGILNTLYTPTYNSIDLLNVLNLHSEDYRNFCLLPKNFDKNLLSLNIEDAYPASHLQVGMLLASELSDTGAYHNVNVQKIMTEFNENKFLEIWNNLINKQELLRAKFLLADNGWICLIEKSIIKYYEVYLDVGIGKIIDFEKNQYFDFGSPGLFKLIVNLRPNNFDLIFSYHHAIADGSSAAMLMRQFAAAYHHNTNINSSSRLSYGEFVKKELESIESVSNNKFWRDYLENVDAANKIKWNFSNTNSINGVETFSVKLNDQDQMKIFDIARDNLIGIDNIFLYAYLKTLSQFLNQNLITIGLMVENKMQSHDDSFLLGLFSNIIPFQFNIENVKNNQNGVLTTFAQKVRLFKYKEFPYSKIKEIVKKDVFQFAFNYNSFQFSDIGYERSNIPFRLNISNQVDSFIINFIAHDDIIDKEYLEYFSNYYIFHLRDIINNPENNNLDLIPEDYKKIVYDWNNTEVAFPKEKTIPQLFEEQVEKTPDNIAIVYESIQLTYRELNNRANLLSTILVEKYRIQVEDLVALYLDRSEYMIIAILGVLKSGAAYVPIATDYPEERINYIINDIKTKLIITNEIFYDKLVSLKYSNISNHKITNTDYDIYIIESIKTNYTDMFAMMNPIIGLKSNNMAYVIYTSGTTGTPKGVMIEHKAISSLVYNSYIKVSSNDIFLFLSSISFDASTFEIWNSLLNGAQLYIPNLTTNMLGVEDLENILEKNKISILWLTKSLFDEFIIANKMIFKDLEYLIIGGEALNIITVNKLLDSKHAPKNLLNGYGPTESTTFTCTYKILSNFSNYSSIPIGKPIDNRKIYILSKDLMPLPIGSIGELYIGGDGIARGYLNQENLTNEKFMPDLFQPFEEKQLGYNKRMYKTGDLVRFLPDYNIEYIGRNDDQIKMRGYRIELDEINAVLSAIPEIAQAFVTVRNYNIFENEYSINKYLIGYYILNKQYSQDEIFNNLRLVLPEYLVPRYLIEMQKFPLKTNGKLNTELLPAPNLNIKNTRKEPKNNIEKYLIQIWSTLLNLDSQSISVDDNFFYIGGNSILAIKLANLCNLKFESQIFVRDIFFLKTISQLSNLILQRHGTFKYKNFIIDENINFNTDESQWFELTNVQQAYLYGRLETFELGNISTHLYAEFLFDNFNLDKFELSLNILIKRHEAMRTIFKDNLQYILPNVSAYKIKNHGKVLKLELKQIRKKLSHKIYSIEHWPLFDYELSNYNNKYIIHMSTDALVMDSISWDIFYFELTKLYNSNDPTKVNLSVIKINFSDYIAKLYEIRNSYLFKESEIYWLKKLDEYDFNNMLPLKKAINLIKKPIFSRKTAIITNERWSKIEDNINVLGISITTLVIFAYGYILTKWSGSNKFCINLTLFNRLPIHKQINEILGDFTVLSLFNYTQEYNISIKDHLKLIHEVLWNDLEHNLFDGIDFQRLIKKNHGKMQNSLLSPVVLTSMLGNIQYGFSKLDGYYSTGYSITQTSQVYLDNKAYKTKEGFVAEWDYIEEIFDKEMIAQMHFEYCSLLEYLSEADWGKNVQEFDLSKSEYEIIRNINKSKQKKSNDSLVSIFDKSSKEFSNNIAIIDKKGSYSYNEISIKAFNIAKYFLLHFNKEEKLIAILAEKGYQQVISCIGIMKSGYAYLPLNIDWPLGRILDILNEGNVSRILVSKNYYEFNKENIHSDKSLNKYEWLIIEDLINTQPIKFNKNIKLPKILIDDIAYVIFTSGSTGKPKGVTILHKGAINTIIAVNNKYNLNSSDKVLALSELSFDLSVYDIFGMLACGGTIIYPDQEKSKDLTHWYDLCLKYNITIWNSVPQLMQLFIDYIQDYQKYTSIKNLRLILLSGDWIPLKLPINIKSFNENCEIVSLGGATECSIWSIWYEINNVNPNWKSIPYGVAMPNQKIYVLNRYTKEHCHVGVEGEIYIGGCGVALNYWGDLDKTKNSFIEDELIGKIYKTGDIGKYNKNGYIEFLGRVDNQIKLNGYRVELAEIISKINNIEGIEKSIVFIKNNLLMAYYVENRNADLNNLTQDFIVSQLNNHLPQYMIPHYFIKIKDFPLTANGKLNEKLLPDPEYFETENYQAPVNEPEAILINAFSKILNISFNKISRNSDFFSLGGNSLLAIKLISILNNEGLKINLNNLFNLRTPYLLINYLEKNQSLQNKFNNKIDHIKYAHIKNNDNSYLFTDSAKEKINNYNLDIKNINIKSNNYNIKNILLTGSTGYLGVHILYELLINTSYRIYLFIRAVSNKHAYKKIKHEFMFYFNLDIEIFKSRVLIFKCDLEIDILKLNNNYFTSIDTIIHSAALVKHYGDYQNFHNANVIATKNLLLFAKKFNIKDFHYISTIGVLSGANSLSNDPLLITENDDINGMVEYSNFYLKTKYEAELAVENYKKLGLNTRIYRVGNLLFNSNNNKLPKTFYNNACFIKIKTMLEIKLMTEDLSRFEISPVNDTAKAIVTLLNKPIESFLSVLHLVNPHIFNLYKIVKQKNYLNVKIVTFDKFVENLIADDKHNNKKLIEQFMLHQMWLENFDMKNYNKVYFLQNKTNSLLSYFNFKWSNVSVESLIDLIDSNSPHLEG